jgi:hypothetical protein
MTRIEYRTAFFSMQELGATLRLYGDDGWILATLVSRGDDYLAVFYRPCGDTVTVSPGRRAPSTAKEMERC